MTRRQYPPIGKGTFPSRQHFNFVSQVAQRFASAGKFGRFGYHGESSVSFDDLFQGVQFIFEITNLKIDDDDTEDSGLYKGRIVWYSHVNEEWDSLTDDEKDNEKEWELDERGVTDPPSFSLGNRVIVYWDAQRGMFIPMFNTNLIELMLAEDHPGKSVVYRAYRGIWCPEHDDWRYDCTDTADDWLYAIDHRLGVPYPDIGARGLYIARKSDTYGIIYENVSMDCETPGSCASQSIDQPCGA